MASRKRNLKVNNELISVLYFLVLLNKYMKDAICLYSHLVLMI